MNVDLDFEKLYAAEAPSVFGAVFLLCRDRALAEDATQEAFARALERWSRLRGQPWTAGWITTTALNVARRALRRRLGLRPPERADVDTDLHLALWTVVSELPPRQQEAVILHYRLDVSVSDIASIFGCADGTVRTHLARARRTLKDRMKGEIDAER